MRQLLGLLALWLALGGSARGQNPTAVTGTITDPSSIAYYPAQVTACLSPVTIRPTVGGQLVNPNIGTNYCIGPVSTALNGSFSMGLHANANIVPGGTTWIFTVTALGSAPPAGTGSQTFQSSGITISGASQDVGATLTALAPKLLAAGGGVSSPTSNITGTFPAGTLAWYRFLPTETPCTGLTDYSGVGNVPTAGGATPTIAAGTGGLVINTSNCLAPAAVNGAKTIIVAMTSPGSVAAGSCADQTNNFSSPVIGNATTAIAGIILQKSNVTNNVPTQNLCIGPMSFDSTNSKTIIPMTWASGVNVYAMTMAASDHVYFNGQEVCPISALATTTCAGGTTSSGINANPFAIGGSANAVGANPTWCQCTIYEVYFNSNALTTPQVQAVTSMFLEDLRNRGVAPIGPFRSDSTNTKRQLLHVGDSNTSQGGGPLSNYYPDIIQSSGGLQNAANWQSVNVGTGNTTLECWTSCGSASNGLPPVGFYHVAGLLAPVINGNGFTQPGVNVIHQWLYTNDCAQNNYSTLTTADAVTQMEGAYVRMLRQYTGQMNPPIYPTIFAASMISRTTFDTCKNVVNPGIRQSWKALGYDGFTDLAMAPMVGADGANTNSAFTGDNVHVNLYSQYNVLTPMIQSTVNGFFGIRDINAANTYAAPTAAVTCTAASEATQTITFTCTGHGFAAGQIISCTGWTPAGYNSNNTFANGLWYVTSVTTNTFTVTGLTTGLGASSVAGTCTQPFLRDFESVAVLNDAGAANWPLPACWVYGQRGYSSSSNPGLLIVNKGAGTATMTALFGESIVGTATVAQNVAAIFQPQLVSQAASGCTWTRIQ